jgi:hypothetical protein
MKKIDRTVDSSVIEKLVSGFFKGSKATRYVADMVDNGKTLYVAVNQERKTSEIEVYDIDQGEFKVLKRIALSEILDEVKKRVGNHNISPNIEISKLHYRDQELEIHLTIGTIITLHVVITKSSGPDTVK